MTITETTVDPVLGEEVEFTDVAPIEPGLEAVLATVTQGDFIAQGGQAQVHRVTKDGIDIAARSVSFRQDDEQIKRLKREARILRGLHHPNIVGYQGYEVNPVKKRWGTDIEFTFYMDWIEGPTLRDLLEGEQHRELSGAEVDNILAQLGSALSYCHDRGILHRDIKPSNIKLMDGDVVKVIDFGLVKKEGETTMTASEGRFLGSYKYAAPEVREGKKAEAAADWYSAAVTLVELLEGKPYSGIVDPADVREKLGKKSFLPSRLKQSLELLLVEDPTVRAVNVERVKGLYGLGKEVVVIESVDDTVDEKKENISIGNEELKRVESGFILGFYSALVSWASAGMSIALSNNFEIGYATGGSIAAALGGGVLGYLIGNYYDSTKAKIKSLWKRKPDGGLLEQKVEETEPTAIDPTILVEQYDIPASEVIAMSETRKREETTVQLQQSILKTAATAGLTLEEKAAEIAEVRTKWNADRFNHSVYAIIESVMTGSSVYVAAEVFQDYGTKPGMVLSAIAGLLGADLIRNITGRREATKNLQLLETNPEKALALYEEEKKGFVRRMTEKYNAWREEKGREWAATTRVEDIDIKLSEYEQYASAKTIRRRVLPALSHWSNRTRERALDVITKQDFEQRDYVAVVKEHVLNARYDWQTRTTLLEYLFNNPNDKPTDEDIDKYLIPYLQRDSNIPESLKDSARKLLVNLRAGNPKYQLLIDRSKPKQGNDRRRFELDADAGMFVPLDRK